MERIKDILKQSAHRPWPQPSSTFSFYQEWNNAVFLHWKICPGKINALLPAGLALDTYGGQAWVSMVAFTMENIRPSFLPSVSFISNFHEINVRTYVTDGKKPGVYFLNIEAEKKLSCIVAKLLSGLPYKKSFIKRSVINDHNHYRSDNAQKGCSLSVHYTKGNNITNAGMLDKWLTERYCLYLEEDHEIYRYEIHHKPWPLQELSISSLSLNYKLGDFILQNHPDLVHYSAGVQVLAWSREKVFKNLVAP